MSRIPCFRRDMLSPAWQISSPIGPEKGKPLSPAEQLRTLLETNWSCFDQETKTDPMVGESDTPLYERCLEASYTFVCRNVAAMQPIIVAQFSERFESGYWPAVAAYQTAKTPDGKDWGDSAVALQSAVFYNQEGVGWLHIDQDQPSDMRRFVPRGDNSAVVVNTGDSREFFCSLILPIAGTPYQYRVVGTLPEGQAHTCLMYCNELLYSADMAHDNVDRVDVFYRSNIQAGSIVQQVQNFYQNAVMIATPVSQLPIKTCVVGIRPHGVAWK